MQVTADDFSGTTTYGVLWAFVIIFAVFLLAAILWCMVFCCRRRTAEGLIIVERGKPMGAFYLDQESFDIY